MNCSYFLQLLNNRTYKFSITVSKFLITTGEGDNGKITKSEVIDLSISGNFHCDDWVDYPIGIAYAVGGLLGATPVVCGGWPYTDKCYKLTAKNAELVATMTIARADSVSVTINGTKLWITGGFGARTSSSSEFVQLNGTMPGPNLPIPFGLHAIININIDLTMIIGGHSSE